MPADVGCAPRPALALAMIQRAVEAEVPFAWVAADSVYRVGDIERGLRRAGKGQMLGVNANSQFSSWINKPEVAGTAAEIADGLDPAAWQRLSSGRTTHRPCPWHRLVVLAPCPPSHRLRWLLNDPDAISPSRTIWE